MEKKRIKYFSYYGCSEPIHERENSPAADTKIDYIIEVLNRCGYGVDHISRAAAATNRYQSAFVDKRGENTFRYFASFGRIKSPLRIFNRWFLDLQFFIWCLINIKRKEQVLVYHSLGYDSIFIKLKLLKNIRILGEIEEIYQDVSKQKPSQERNEYRFIELCDKYIFPNTILNERLNKDNKPFLVVHGIYKVNKYEPVSYYDDKIHILYAGTYDPNKGGALASVKLAEFLPDKYHLHVSGFGSSKDESNVKAEIERVSKITKCQITFHSYLNNAEFLDLMHRCNIGLCTQDPSSKLNLTSFPSKILNYMANGLIVLSGRNRAIEESALGDILHYYDKQDPQVMAEAIMSIKEIDGSVYMTELIKLDRQFEQDIYNWINTK